MTEQTDKMSLEQDLQISAKLAEAAYQALDDKLGQDIRILDIHHISILADYFLIAHGNNPNHVHALIDEVQDRLAELGCESKNVEGYQEGSWVLIDFGRIREVEDPEKIIDISRKLSLKFTDDLEYIEKEVRQSGPRTALLELVPKHMTGKRVTER